ncbi:MAG: sugar transporter substrate-binding protein [Devosia sp.]|uniref:ABC transporter substrate-binding protein n=1 Tax=Devosia sp. TaxID=1871048 RepID=UPI00263379AD|nr:sugar ABC transporter substrate-binding protein [Devosia sp.]MDB5527616.1 sugar transporter substrate-binding protein [Devosia sp.]
MKLTPFIVGALSLALVGTASAETITIAVVNNDDMIRMQALSPAFTAASGVDVNWVVLEENTLRQNVTTDIATNGGQYDVMMIGPYEAPVWAKQGWLTPLDALAADPGFDIDDLLPAMRGALSVDGTLYASPFYGESSMVYYRKDLMEKAGLTMPDAPTWEFIGKAARAMTDRANDINGICLRGKAGWGENMAFLTAMSNSFGARWFDESWHPQFDQPEWKATLDTYLSLMADAGPAGASSNGYNENMTLFQQGKCGMWIDATVAASALIGDKSTVADQVGFALAPDTGLGKRGNWLWTWALAVPKSSQHADAAQKFINWATNKAYIETVAAKEGWANVPPGTRTSLYNNPAYQAAAPFAKTTLDSINSADPQHPTVKPVPYVGVQFAAIPEFAGIATNVGQLFSAALAGQMSADDALKQAQDSTTRDMTRAGYIK